MSPALRVCSTRWVAIGALVAFARNVPAQSVAKMVSEGARHAINDVFATWGSPFHTSDDAWLVATSGLVATAALSAADVQIDRWFLSKQQSGVWSPLRIFREDGRAFAGETITPIAVGVYALGVATNNRGIRDAVWGCAASYATESVVRKEVLYRLIGRQRPDSVRGPHDGSPSEHGDQYQLAVPASKEWGDHSFPAGHVANVAACASFLSYRFSNLGVAIPANLVMAAVGVGRLVDRRHWSSDTLLGMLFGYAVGREVARRSLERLRNDQSVTPFGSRAFVIGWQGTF